MLNSVMKCQSTFHINYNLHSFQKQSRVLHSCQYLIHSNSYIFDNFAVLQFYLSFLCLIMRLNIVKCLWIFNLSSMKFLLIDFPPHFFLQCFLFLFDLHCSHRLHTNYLLFKYVANIYKFAAFLFII